MKKFYEKPSLVLESLVTESILVGDDNALSEIVYNNIQFLTPGSGNTLNSINYADFRN